MISSHFFFSFFFAFLLDRLNAIFCLHSSSYSIRSACGLSISIGVHFGITWMPNKRTKYSNFIRKYFRFSFHLNDSIMHRFASLHMLWVMWDHDERHSNIYSFAFNECQSHLVLRIFLTIHCETFYIPIYNVINFHNLNVSPSLALSLKIEQKYFDDKRRWREKTNPIIANNDKNTFFISQFRFLSKFRQMHKCTSTATTANVNA